MDWKFPVTGPLEADLELSRGRVTVGEAAGDEASVVLEPMRGGGRRAEAAIEAAVVTCIGSQLEVRMPHSMRRDVDLRLQVLIPVGSSARVRTASADLDIELPLAGLDARTASGDVTVRADAGELALETASGDLSCQDVLGRASVRSASGSMRMGSIGGSLAASTASGDLRVESVAGDTNVTTASGDVEIGRVAGDVKVRATSGDVSVGSASAGAVNLNAVSGDIAIGVAKGVGTWLDVSTVSGDTRCELDSEAGDEPEATLRLTCHTVSGDISIRRAAAGAPFEPIGTSERPPVDPEELAPPA